MRLSDKYNYQRAEVRKQINRLNELLAIQDAEFQRGPQTDHGYIGNLTYISEQLEEANSFLGGEREACPECGKPKGEGIEEWCFFCAKHNGVIAG